MEIERVLQQQKMLINGKLDELFERTSFLFEKYTYHHANDELEILKKYICRLNEAKEELDHSLMCRDELISSINEGYKKVREAEELLEEIHRTPAE